MGVSATPNFSAILAATLIAGYQALCATLLSTVHNWHPGSTIAWGREHKMGSVHHRVRRDGRREQHGTSHVSVPVSGNDFGISGLFGGIGVIIALSRQFKKTSCSRCWTRQTGPPFHCIGNSLMF
ncbi:hypothetical protein QBC32DRAFT_371104 [Pseudoneurospora amorphoporcata]|uniref:Uncharacterized protein n=1 Tax=Pseudoneurospora amorphoporcata TaxID=241081 RepID=A0AAN6NT18_9PEZI|nr:hypothetical protein QBC32DRAFT_371104 [Pseudoneurospora amorphoporcata]